MYFQHIGLIDSEESRKRLKQIHDRNVANGIHEIRSDLRCAVAFLDMDRYLKKGRAEPRTLSH